MLLMDAKAQIDARLSETMQADYRKHIPEYFEALEIASASIEKQLELVCYINDLEQCANTPSIMEIVDLLKSLCICTEGTANE